MLLMEGLIPDLIGCKGDVFCALVFSLSLGSIYQYHLYLLINHIQIVGMLNNEITIS